jgi:hypothetical protein
MNCNNKIIKAGLRQEEEEDHKIKAGADSNKATNRIKI